MKLSKKMRGKRLGIWLAVMGLVFGSFVITSPVNAVGNFSNGLIADKAELRPDGQWAGQCKAFVNTVVSEASNGTMSVAGGYQGAFAAAGGLEITPSNAVRGDIIQVTPAGSTDATAESLFNLSMPSRQLHTAVILTNNGGGSFGVIDSNSSGHPEQVYRHTYNPYTSAAGSIIKIWRLGQVSTSTTSVRAISSDSSDVNADGKSDLVIYDHGRWYIKSGQSSYGMLEPDFAWGDSDDVPLTGDMDNDGKADLIRYRSGTWYVKSATNSPTTRYDVQQGLVVGGPNCIPMVGDVNNDGWTDYVADCNGHWDARSGQSPYNWIFQDLVVGGNSNDKPFVADFDGDGYDDIGIVSGTQWAARSTNPSLGYGMMFQGLNYGGSGCLPLVGYFNTDTKADIALDCGGTWQALDVDYTLNHSWPTLTLTFQGINLGNSTSIPVIGDYWDNDQRSDIGVYNGNVWEAVRGEPGYSAIFTGLGYATGGGTIPIAGSESPAGP